MQTNEEMVTLPLCPNKLHLCSLRAAVSSTGTGTWSLLPIAALEITNGNVRGMLSFSCPVWSYVSADQHAICCS